MVAKTPGTEKRFEVATENRAALLPGNDLGDAIRKIGLTSRAKELLDKALRGANTP